MLNFQFQTLPNKNFSMKQQPNTISFVKKHIQQKHQPKPKQYCCLYHYLQGKKTKGLTPCNNHVRLGVINPITVLDLKERQLIKMSRVNKFKELVLYGKKGKGLEVNADQYDLNFHTHFINEIQKRGSMPRQLIKPRVYVEKVYQRNQFQKRQNFLYPKTQNQSSFKQIYNFYRKFAQQTQFKNSQQLRDDIISFSRQNNIKTANLSSQATINIDKSTACQYLFSKQDFKTYLLTHGFSQSQASEFWSIAYNKDRFTIPEKSASSLAILKNEFVSMKAFVYNFQKFYLDQQEYYRNVFSEPALRQRLIDLRLTLQPWFNKNIILKSKLKKWKATQLEIAEYLKTSGYQNQYENLIKFIQERNRLYFMMRTLSKSVYDLTDQKNIGLDVWNNRITYLIEEKSDSLICFMEFIEKFKQHQVERQLDFVQPNQAQNKFKITELLQFLHQNRNSYEELQQKWIIKWIRNIYKYLYFYKNIEQLQIDPKTLQLSCKAQIQVQNQLISQFIHYKTNETDNFLQVLTKLTQQIEQKLELRPQLQGHKKYLVQCNYLTETLLRIIRKNNFAYFQILNQINQIAEDHWFDFQGFIEEIVSYIRENKDNTKKFDANDKFWKQYFTFKLQMGSELNKTLTTQNKEVYTYKDAYDKYQNVKEALGISKKYANNQSQANPLKVTKVQKSKEKNPKNLPKKAQKFLTQVQQNKQDLKQKFQTFDWQMKYKRHEKQHCTNGYCMQCQDIVSTEVNSTISRVEDMQNYLMDLLRDV